MSTLLSKLPASNKPLTKFIGANVPIHIYDAVRRAAKERKERVSSVIEAGLKLYVEETGALKPNQGAREIL